MKQLQRLAALALGATLVAPAGHAGEREVLLRVERALARVESGEDVSGRAELRSALGELAKRDAIQQRAFADADRKQLPAKARARLEAAQRAYAEGQGRLLELLRELSAEPAPAARKRTRQPIPLELQASPAVRLEEARERLRKLEAASRREPLSLAALPVRAPESRPALSGALLATQASLPVGSIPGILKDQAAQLASPVDVYEYVRNAIRPEFYHGVMKGPVQTYLEQAGNDADTATLLVMLLRAKGYEARYLRGTAVIPAATLAAMTGTASAEQAVRVLERAGIPHETVLGAGGVESVKWERTWVEAYVPYVNYRGAVLDAQGKFWIPLDAGFKKLSTPVGIDAVAALGFDARATLDDYLAQLDGRRPLEFARDRVRSLLDAAQPGAPYETVLNHRDTLSEALALLPSTLPFAVIGRSEPSYDLSDTLRHGVRVIGELDGQPLFDATLAIEDVLGKRLTLSYAPFSGEDEAVVRQYGSLPLTPPFLIEVRPILKSGGIPVAAGDSPIGMGVKYTLRLEFTGPGASERVSNSVLAGNLIAIGLGGRRVTGSETHESQAAEILSARAWGYLNRWNASDEELADLFHVVPVRPTVSACLVLSDVETQYAGGDPLYPLTFDWKGIAIDADLRSTAPVGVESSARERDFLLISGLEGSVLENRIFEDDLGIESVSTGKALQLAHAQGVDVVDLTDANVDAILPGLPLDPGVKDEIQAATARGLLARVPVQNVTHLAWSGVGYLLLDEETGQAAYQLQGGHSGGVTAPAVADFPKEIKDPLAEQREEPVPGGMDVVKIEKFLSRDFQFGTVDKELAKPFKVLVTDVDGYAVPKAPVTFQAFGGGGHFLDPITGSPAGEKVVVFSNAAGEAEARFVLGKSTAEIARYFSAEGDENATQMGLNVATAYTTNAFMSDPFSAYGAPDDRFDGTSTYVTLSWLGAYQFGDGILQAGAVMNVAVRDQHDNPISNARIRFSYVPEPVQQPAPEGWFHMHGPTTTPGTLLGPHELATCPPGDYIPIRGDCPGEAQIVIVPSSVFGAGAYAILGDSPFSRYKYEANTTAEPPGTPLTAEFGTSEYLCPVPPNGTNCQGNPRRPDPAIVDQSHRPTLLNDAANVIEAYPLGGRGKMTFRATALYEDAVAYPGGTAYFAKGLGTWKRRPLTNSEFELESKTPGTDVDPPTVTYQDGQYAGEMIMAPTPQLNTVRFVGNHRSDTLRYQPRNTPGGAHQLYPEDVDPLTLQITRHPATEPLRLEGTMDLWGIRVTIDKVDPAPVLASRAGTVLQKSKVVPRFEPAEYKDLLRPSDVLFQVTRTDPPAAGGTEPVQTEVLTANGVGDYTIPAGLAMPEADYSGRVVLPRVSFTSPDTSLKSAAEPLLTCPLVNVTTPVVRLTLTRDPVNGTTCGEEGDLEFTLCRDSLVTLEVEGESFTGALDNSAPGLIVDVPLQKGKHSITLPAGLLGLTLDATAPFTVKAVAMADPSLRAEDEGTILNAVGNKSVLPVGHTFVKGVDLFDGHVVQQATDLKARGRHLGLEVTRTYSSTGRDPEGLMGAGWGFNYESRVIVTGCAVIVKTADGSSQLFTPIGGGRFTPQKGYHTKLELNTGDGSYDFTDKAGNVHHFREPEDLLKPNGTRRLEYIREPHGDELRFAYDTFGRLASVSEWHPDGNPDQNVRTLTVSYGKKVNGFDRIESVRIDPHGITASYGYDGVGNLTGASTSTGLAWTYQYTGALDPRDRFQLTAVLSDPNGNRTEYAYYGPDDLFPGEQIGAGGNLVVVQKQEFVKLVREFPEKGDVQQFVETEFSYDYREALSGRFKTTVRDAETHETRYVMNANGSPLRIEEPEGRVTEMQWAPDDILKTQEKDPNLRITDYQYEDGRGNLTREIVTAPGIGPVATTYQYDSRFNKLTFKQDAEGRQTFYGIGPNTGDLLTMTDAVGNQTVYGYDARGQLQSVQDPRGNVTSYSGGGFTDYGDAFEIDDPLGNRTTRGYDRRGRLMSESDTMGRARSLGYDEQDRVTSQLRVAGGSAENRDEATSTQYYPLGQVHFQTNGNGGQTEYVLDGMDRVKETRTPSGTIFTDWNGDGTKQVETDRRQVRREFQYDGAHRLKRVAITAGVPGEPLVPEVAYFEYDKVGNKLLERDHAGRVTEYQYDGLYRVERKLLPESGPNGRYFERSVYDKVGNRLAFFDANGHETRYGYDGLNRVTEVHRDPSGLDLTTLTRYDDPNGTHVNKSSDEELPRGLRTEYEYDALNRENLRRVILAGEDGDPTTLNVTYPTITTYQDATHAMTIKDPRLNDMIVKMDGLDRVIERTALNVEGRDLVTQMGYDGLSNKRLEIDPENRRKEWVYDGQGRLTDAIDFAGPRHYDYDGEGLKANETDRRGVERAFTYDNLGRPRTERLTTVSSGVPWSRAIGYTDAASNWRRSETDARGNDTVFQLDGMGRVTRVTDPANKFTETTWDGVNRVAEKDKRGNTTAFGYDAVNRLTTTIDPAPFVGQTVVVDYQDALNQRIEKDRRGIRTVTQTDALGRVVKVTRAVGTADVADLERNTYDGNGNKTLAEDAEGKRTLFEYDAANRLIARTDGYGTGDAATTGFVVDGAGNKTAEIDPRATAAEPSMRYRYDDANRLTDAFDGEGDQTHYVLDGEGNRTELHEPMGQVTAYGYEELGKLLSVTQPATEDHPAPATRYAYDENRNRRFQYDAKNHEVEMTYDTLNRLDLMIQKGAPEGDLVTNHDYDENGNETKLTDPKGQTVTNAYDELNRLKTKTYAFAAGDPVRPWRHTTSIAYSLYDENSNLRTVDESVASGTDPPEILTTTRDFDNLDRLTSETTALPDGGRKTVGYSYFKNGTRQSVSDPEGGTTSYLYDGQNRLKTATTAAGDTAYAYFPDDLLQTVGYPNGVIATHAYDKADRLLSVTNAQAGATVSSFIYTDGTLSYDPNGNRLVQIETNGGAVETTRYGYDTLNRLKTVAYPADASFPAGRVVTYLYDAVGNRERETTTDPGGAVLADKRGIFDSLNRLTALDDLVTPTASTSFTWDKNGNQLTKTVGSGASAVTTTYLYDVRDRMVEAQQGSSISGRFQYDFEGRRTKKIGEEGIRQYVYDDTSLFAEYDQAGARKALYNYGSDRLISLTRSDEGRRFFSFDGLRSAVNLTDDLGSTTASYHLDAFGNYRFPTELDSSKNRFGFTGYLFDSETKLYFAKARFYDPTVGRFTSQDSFLGKIDDPPSLHRYFYANANPTRYIDPTGHEAESANQDDMSLQEALANYKGDPGAGAKQQPGFWARLGEKTREGYRAVKRFVGITEDGPVAGGDSTEKPEAEHAANSFADDVQARIDAVQASKQQSLETAAEFGRIGEKVGETVLGASAASDIATLATGKDLNEQESSQIVALVSLGTAGAAGLIAKYGDRIPLLRKFLGKADDVAQDARTARRTDYANEGGEFLGDGVRFGDTLAPSSAATGSPWAKGPGPRGLAIEDAVEASGLRSGRLPKGFRGVDFHEGVVTSTKSVDLGLPSYQNPVRLQKTLQGYVDKLEAFQGGALKGRVIRPSDIAGRQLDVAIPSGPLNASQRLAIETAQAYGSARGIRVNVFVVE